MHCQHRVGILLGTPLLQRILSGKSTHEKAHLSFESGKKYGVCPVLFDLKGLSLKETNSHGLRLETVKAPLCPHGLPTSQGGPQTGLHAFSETRRPLSIFGQSVVQSADKPK